jgi:Domain of unknown function (DUF4129)
MPRSRPEQTLADYVAIAISPVLIMLLVGSLCFFLAEVMAREAATGTFRWVLFFYVFAIVLISRIGIEQGKAYAAGYAAVLAAAVALVAIRLLPGGAALAAFVLLGIVWWATNKLVWDCTLIDDKQDASGQGLLRASGLEGAAPEDGRANPQAAADEEKKAKPSLWRRWFDRWTEAPLEETQTKAAHAPGTWVVYFSLAALPLFGVGQLMIRDDAGRAFAFKLLWLYVASGLALLVTTSFLGLRRYLRQRKLSMPPTVTRAWLTTGGGLILVIMLLCLLLPRPQAAYSLPNVVDRISTKIGKASQNAFVKGEAGEGEGNRIGKRDGKDFDRGKGGDKGPDNEHGDGGGKKKSGGKGDGKAKQGAGKKRGKGQGGKDGPRDDKNKNAAQRGKNQQQANGKGEQKQGNDQQKDQQQGGGSGRGSDTRRQDSSRSSGSPPGGAIGNAVKWIIYALLAAGILFIVVKYRDQIAEGIRRFLADLRNLFARKPATAASAKPQATTAQPPKVAPRPFSTFANPFETGTADQMQTATVIAYTFEAMEAWAYERNVERGPEQTPLEFAREIGDEAPELGKDAVRVARLYTRAAYSETPPSDKCRDQLRETWHQMSASAAPPPAFGDSSSAV